MSVFLNDFFVKEKKCGDYPFFKASPHLFLLEITD